MRPKIVASNALQWWPKTASFCIFATLKCCVYFGWSVNSFLCSVKARNSWLVLTICSKSRSFQISWLKQSESAEFWQNKQTHSFGFARIREISVICQIREMGTYLTIDAERAFSFWEFHRGSPNCTWLKFVFLSKGESMSKYIFWNL